MMPTQELENFNDEETDRGTVAKGAAVQGSVAQDAAAEGGAFQDIAIRNVRARLFSLQDLEYKEFHRKLLPTVDPDRIIGVRVPKVRALAKELRNTPESHAFLGVLPHRYFEENNLHGFLIEYMNDFDEAAEALDALLPHIDNWATCDSISPKTFSQHPDKLLAKIDEWLSSDKAFTVRFAIGMLMKHFLDDRFEERFLDIVANIACEGWHDDSKASARACSDGDLLRGNIYDNNHYVNMMRAWYFATALAKQTEATLPYIEQRRLDQWTHNKAVQKAIESRRVNPELKAHLRTLRR